VAARLNHHPDTSNPSDQTMKPQLVVQDLSGVHNADLTKTSARLMRGGSWKRQRVIVILPAADQVPAKCALSWWNLAFPPNQGVVRILAQGMEVGEAYSTAIEQILANPDLSTWEYILTIEHDNAPPPDGVIRLIQDMEEHPEYAVIGGLYFTKGPDGVAQMWGDPRDPIPNFRPQVPIAETVQEVCGTGMGFNLWRLSMFKDEKLRRPWFKTLNGSEGQGIGTQDLYFAADARKHGYRFAIDTRVKVGHHDLRGDFGPADTMY
jgi:hypothetical protein